LRLAVGDDEVVLFSCDREVWRFRWDEVTKITSYKRDLFTVDLICLDFFVASRQLTYPTHEEMRGFRELAERMCRVFPSIAETWWPQVAFPAFATNERTLYEAGKD
jgi:hypothetical protein